MYLCSGGADATTETDRSPQRNLRTTAMKLTRGILGIDRDEGGKGSMVPVVSIQLSETSTPKRRLSSETFYVVVQGRSGKTNFFLHRRYCFSSFPAETAASSGRIIHPLAGGFGRTLVRMGPSPNNRAVLLEDVRQLVQYFQRQALESPGSSVTEPSRRRVTTRKCRERNKLQVTSQSFLTELLLNMFPCEADSRSFSQPVAAVQFSRVTDCGVPWSSQG